MPQVPTVQFGQDMIQPVRAPQLGPDSFGAKSYATIEQGAEAGLKLGDSMRAIQFYSDKTQGIMTANNMKLTSDQAIQAMHARPDSDFVPDKDNKIPALEGYKSAMHAAQDRVLVGLGGDQKEFAAGYMQRIGPEQSEKALNVAVKRVMEVHVKTVDNQLGILGAAIGNGETTTIDPKTQQSVDAVDYFSQQAQSIGREPGPALLKVVHDVGGNNPAGALTILYNGVKSGVIDPQVAEMNRPYYENKIKTVDGRITDVKASKETFDQFEQVALRKPQAIRGLSDDQFNAVTKDWTVADQNKALVKRDALNRYAPGNDREQMAVNLARGIMPDLVPTKDPSGNAIPENGEARSAEEMKLRGYLFQQVDIMSEGDAKNPDKIRAIVEDAKNPSHYYDGDKMKLLKKYQVPYATSFSAPSTESGWQTMLWGMLPFSQNGQGRHALPAGTKAATPTSGIHKGENVLQVPRGAGGYNIINADTGQ